MVWVFTALLTALAALTWREAVGSTDTLWPHVALFFWVFVLFAVSGRAARIRARSFWGGLTARRRWALGGGIALLAAAGATQLISPLWSAAVCASTVLWASFERPRLSLPALALAVGVSLGAVEMALLWMSHSAEAAGSSAFRQLAVTVYNRFAPVFQFEPECTVFDPELLYKIAPGGCVFEGEEFRVHVPGNSLGLPDDEESLEAPRVVFAGDSWTMGWGVEPPQSFPARFEAETGIPTLTAAVASYGTARELLMLSRVDRSRLERLYLQYHPNDAEENRTFVSRGCSLPPHQPRDFQRWINYYAGYRRYWPGKASAFLLRGALIRVQESLPLRSAFFGAPGKRATLSEHDALIGVLECFATMLSGVEIRIFSAQQPGLSRSTFLEDVAADIVREPTLFESSVQALQLEQFSVDEFFLLDTHPNAAGHAAIAEAVIEDWKGRE